MFYDNTLPTKKLKYVDLKLEPFSVGQNSDLDPNILKLSKAQQSYNYRYDNGALKQGYGFRSMTLPNSETSTDPSERQVLFDKGSDILGLWHYKFYSETYQKKQHSFVVYCKDTNLYWFKTFVDDPYLHPLYDKTLQSKPTVINYRLNGRDILIFCTPEDGMLVWDCDIMPYSVATAPTIRSMCLHKDRLFAIVQDMPSTIRYSKNLDPTNWLVTGDAEDSGVIAISDQMGDMNKIISFLGYIYIFRDYGITKLAFYDENGEYTISQLYYSGSRIIPDTVTVCGNKIFFMTNDGIYSFDGINTKKLTLDILSMMPSFNDKAVACFHADKYYLACKLNYNDDQTILDETNDDCINNTLIVVDVKSGAFTLTRGIDISSMLSVEEENISKIFFCKRCSNSDKVSELTFDGNYYDQPMPKVWRSTLSDLGYIDQAKIVKEIFIRTLYDCKLQLVTTSYTKTYDLKGDLSPQRLRVNIKDKLIGINIISYTQADISCPTIRIGLGV